MKKKILKNMPCLMCSGTPYRCNSCYGTGKVSKIKYKGQQEFIKWCAGNEEYRRKTSLWS